jgi:CheY-like chemotaxis protein
VVDDSLVVRKFFAMALKRIGYEVTQAENGLEGLHRMMETMFDLVLCDFLMPVMDGFDCVKQFRTWEAENRTSFRQLIVGISAHADKGVAGQGLDAGMDDFIPKPIGIKILNELKESRAVQESSSALDKLEVVPDSAISHFPQGVQHPRRCSSGASLDGLVIQLPSSIASPISMRKSSFNQHLSALTLAPTQGSLRPGLFASLPVGNAGTAIMPTATNKEMACLIATDRPTRTSHQVLTNLEAQGWKVVIVNDGANALRLLQMRNWDAVLIDSDLPDGTAFVQEFREWEHNNRVNRQKNTVYVSVAEIPSPTDETSIVQAPSGFDYVLHKPLVWTDLKYLLDRDSSMGIVFKMVQTEITRTSA